MGNSSEDKRLEKGQQSRERILQAAIIIIAESGIREVSAGKLAAATGMSKSNIFHHFKSIDEILMSVFQIIFDDFINHLNREFKDLEQFLNILGESAYLMSDKFLKFFKAFYSFYHEGMFNLEYQNLLVLCANQITELLRRQLTHLSSPSISSHLIESVSVILLTMMDGFGLHAILQGGGEKYEHAWRLQVQLLSQYLLKS